VRGQLRRARRRAGPEGPRAGTIATFLLLAALPVAVGSIAVTQPARETGQRQGGLVIISHTSTPVEAQALPAFLTQPAVTDVTPGGFRVSWLADQQVTGTLYWANVPNPAAWNSSALDGPASTVNGAVVVDTTGVLATGTVHYWKVRQQAGAEESWHPSIGTESVRTEDAVGTSCGTNPFLDIGPYHDGNGNRIWDAEPVDRAQVRFLVQLTHAGAGQLAARGGDSGDPALWNATLSTDNLITKDPGDDYHCLTDGHHPSGLAPFTFSIHGLYDDGTGKKHWQNTTAAYNWPTSGPIFVDMRFATEVPELGAPAAAFTLVAFGAVAARAAGGRLENKGSPSIRKVGALRRR
jgi:hypothetical protein